ncbi:MAG TPA: DUF4162 domain-containing protein, partial [Caulobacter sp.]|nr:DUF4162 domain-containing protein [Caulobacter sp.]
VKPHGALANLAADDRAVADAITGAVAALPGVESVTTEAIEDGGTRFTATLGKGAAGQDALRAALAGGHDIHRFEMREPSLHDAFIALTGGESAQ